MSTDVPSPRRRRFLAALPGVLLAGLACRPPSSDSPAARPLTYVALGASDTVGVGATSPERESWPAVLHDRLPRGSRLVNLGISGSLLRQALEQQLPVALESAPDLVTVWLAVNDYAARVPLEPYQSDLSILLGELRSKTQATILVGNIPDLGALPTASRFDLRFVDRWNTAIEAVARQHEAALVDLRAIWAELREYPEYVSSDGFHPSTAGYRRLADLFFDSAAPRLGLHA
jgi:lysophospholipase L1-like esterase